MNDQTDCDARISADGTQECLSQRLPSRQRWLWGPFVKAWFSGYPPTGPFIEVLFQCL